MKMVSKNDFVINLGDETEINSSQEQHMSENEENLNTKDDEGNEESSDNAQSTETYLEENSNFALEQIDDSNENKSNKDIDHFLNQDYNEIEQNQNPEDNSNKSFEEVPTINIFDESPQPDVKEYDEIKDNSEDSVDYSNNNSYNKINNSDESGINLFSIANNGKDKSETEETELEETSIDESETKEKNETENLIEKISDQGGENGEVLENLKERGVSFNLSEDEEINDDLEVIQNIKENQKNKKKVAFMFMGFFIVLTFSFLSYRYIDFNYYTASINGNINSILSLKNSNEKDKNTNDKEINTNKKEKTEKSNITQKNTVNTNNSDHSKISYNQFKRAKDNLSSNLTSRKVIKLNNKLYDWINSKEIDKYDNKTTIKIKLIYKNILKFSENLNTSNKKKYLEYIYRLYYLLKNK